MSLTKRTDTIGLFFERLRIALNNYDDPEWLGENSPLAAPYFLGAALLDIPEAETAVVRGRVLQQAIQAAADNLWQGALPDSRDALETAVQAARQEQGNSSHRYHFLLLELRYLRRYFRPQAYPQSGSEQAIRDYLRVGRGPYFNHLKAARLALGEALINYLQPTFRLEQPPSFTGQFIGRETLIDKCLVNLQADQTVAITGMGGVGKTSLGAAVAAQWPQQFVFWFTFWPSLNDQLSSLLFSLGYCLHQRGVSGLWLQLVADNGKLDNPHLVLEQVRGDLHQLNPKPLLCIDEIDRIIADAEKTTPAQQQLLSFLASLRGLVPVLLIGQKVNLLTDAHHTLTGLTSTQTRTILVQNRTRHTHEEASRLHAYTGGNARMIWLCAALCRNGSADPTPSLTEILDSLPETAVFQVLFTRFWQALIGDERQFLRQIAVFRGPVPIDAFPQAAVIIDHLISQHVLQPDGQGAVLLLPIIRDLIYEDHQRLTAEAREQAHLIAADVRAERGEYTAAVYHFIRSGEATYAVQVWYPQRQQEIRRGQAAVALALFEQISQRRLPEEEARALALIKAELYQLTGETEQGLAELDTVKWKQTEETAVQAHLLQGAFLNALGQPQAALAKLEDGLDTIARLLEQTVRFREQRTLIHVQQWQMPEAIREARLAQYTTEHLQGLIQEQQGNYDEAFLAYQRALVLARSIDYGAGMAQTNRDLAAVLRRQSRLDEAQQHLQSALDYYDSIGDRLSWEKARSTLGGIHFEAREYAEVVAIGEASLPFFERAKIPYYASITAANLAESYYELGDLAQAEFYARKTLSLEETHSYPYALYTLGLVRRAQREYAAAVQVLRQAREVAADNEDSFMEAYALRLLGEVLADQGEKETAVLTLNQALDRFNQLNIRYEVDIILDMLAELKA